MYKEIFIDFQGKKTSILIDCLYEENQNRVPCFIVGLSSHYHDKFSSEFRERYELVLMDLYWTDSDYSNEYIENLSLKDMAIHIEEVRCQMQSEFGEKYNKILILGHSAYGFLPLEYAFLYKSHLYGIVNICTPPYFKENDLQKLQTEYIDSNFGPNAPGGPDIRYFDYYQYRQQHEKVIATMPADSQKKKFVRWYISMGPILWKERSFWQNKNGKADAIWNPWVINLVASKMGKNKTIRDVNMVTLEHYFKLATQVDYRSIFYQIDVPVLWFIGLFDARVSAYFFEFKHENTPIAKNIEFYYTDTGHWPMYEEGHFEFDKKVCEWIDRAAQQDSDNEKSCYFYKL